MLRKHKHGLVVFDRKRSYYVNEINCKDFHVIQKNDTVTFLGNVVTDWILGRHGMLKSTKFRAELDSGFDIQRVHLADFEWDFYNRFNTPTERFLVCVDWGRHTKYLTNQI